MIMIAGTSFFATNVQHVRGTQHGPLRLATRRVIATTARPAWEGCARKRQRHEALRR